MYPNHYESSAIVPAPADMVFAYADNQAHLSSHMSQSSWKMGGGRMRVELDNGQGQRVGSHIRLSGRVFGMEMAVEEAVTERIPPRRKVWETVGQPRLLVIGQYRMGFDISPQDRGSRLTVFIDYALPAAGFAHWLASIFGSYYARWCTRQMAEGVTEHFTSHPYRTPA